LTIPGRETSVCRVKKRGYLRSKFIAAQGRAMMIVEGRREMPSDVPPGVKERLKDTDD
jgi:hypothetical protein